MNKKSETDYEPINIIKQIPAQTDSPPDDLSSVLIKFLKKFNITTGIFIFMLYILISTDSFQLHIIKELHSTAYDPGTDTITETGIVFNGVILSVFYMMYDACYST